MHRTFITAVLTACTAPITAALAAPGAGLEMQSSVIAAGGGECAGDTFSMVNTIGQHDAGSMSGGTFELAGGFLQGGALTPPCPGDTDGSGTVDVDDLVNVILDWGSDGSGSGGDVNGSGNVDVDDLVAVILGWGMCQ